jgi:hypothetical protein
LTRNRTAAGSEIAGAVFWAARAGGGRRVGQEGAVRCSGAGGARNWREGVAEVANGGGQRSSGEVVERRRKKNRNAGACEGIEEGRSSLGVFQSQKRHVGAFQSQKEARGRAASSCWWLTARVAAWAGNGATRPCEEEPAGLGEWRAGELGARWRRKSSEGAAGG